MRKDLIEIMKRLCKYKGVEILEGHMMPDHVHMLVAIPPKISVSSFMGYLKGKKSLMIFEKHAQLKYKYGNRKFWAEGYYVSTVGLNDKCQIPPTLVGCWAHIRRKYDEALKTAPEARKNPHSVAAQGMAFCNQLFAIERKLQDITPEERYKARMEQNLPVLNDYETWLRQQRSRTMSKSLLGQAIAYSLN